MCAEKSTHFDEAIQKYSVSDTKTVKLYWNSLFVQNGCCCSDSVAQWRYGCNRSQQFDFSAWETLIIPCFLFTCRIIPEMWVRPNAKNIMSLSCERCEIFMGFPCLFQLSGRLYCCRRWRLRTSCKIILRENWGVGWGWGVKWVEFLLIFAFLWNCKLEQY